MRAEAAMDVECQLFQSQSQSFAIAANSHFQACLSMTRYMLHPV
jgi:hypothetical protein